METEDMAMDMSGGDELNGFSEKRLMWILSTWGLPFVFKNSRKYWEEGAGHVMNRLVGPGFTLLLNVPHRLSLKVPDSGDLVSWGMGRRGSKLAEEYVWETKGRGVSRKQRASQLLYLREGIVVKSLSKCKFGRKTSGLDNRYLQVYQAIVIESGPLENVVINTLNNDYG